MALAPVATLGTLALPRPNYGTNTYLGVNTKRRVREREPRRCNEVGIRWRIPYSHGGGVPVSDSKARAKGVASELKGLTIEPTEAMVRSETARAKLATCARTMR